MVLPWNKQIVGGYSVGNGWQGNVGCIRGVLCALLFMKSAHGVLVCQTKIINKPVQSNHTHTPK